MKTKLIVAGVLTALAMSLSCQAQENKNGSLVQHLTKAQFLSTIWNYEGNPESWKLQSKRPCIIDFYADWCGPCRQLTPILEEIAQEYAGKVDIYKINVDQERELVAAFSVSSIPMLLFCPTEGAPQIARGFMAREELQQAIKEILKQ